jgi:hypothetical protein
MTARELALFQASIANSKSYLEFGCGGSTVVAVSAGIERIVSIETDFSWIEKLRTVAVIREAEDQGILELRHVNIGPLGDWGVPKDRSRVENWPHYYAGPWRAGSSYEFVLVDGRFRIACALIAALSADAASKIAIHDYTAPERIRYQIVEKYLERTDEAGSLIVFKKREDLDPKALSIDLIGHLFDYG